MNKPIAAHPISATVLTSLQKIPLSLILLCLPWLALLGWLATVSWFITDDAFISFRYVRNLLEGHGLVFNPGERVEGYSNFLWVLELAAIWKILGIPPEYAAQWLSVGFTAATILAVLWWVLRTPSMPHRHLVAWIALGLLCNSATFGVWTSGGGLETRQFTFFIVAAVACLSVYGNNRWGLLAASLSLAAAEYTRPEGSLLAACCIGWFVVHRVVGERQLRVDWRQLLYLAVPVIILIAAHYLFRYAYYGDWLPNTYYAKHVRPWYEAGIRYLWAASLETGLYLLLPLAFTALAVRWRKYKDGIYALILLCITAHMAYLMRIGGDHFEYRPMDFYWPLLSVPAAVGIVHIGSQLAAVRWLRSLPRWLGVRTSSSIWKPMDRLLSPKAGVRTCALIIFAPVLFYTSAIQGALLFEGVATQMYIARLHIELNDANAGWLLSAPGMPTLVAASYDLRKQLAERANALHFVGHREYARERLRMWKPYENMERGVIPDDALTAAGALGIQFYYLPDLKVVDINGLTDTVVARNPVTIPNHERRIAHDREPPPGYLEERGVNFTINQAAFSQSQALYRASYAAKVGDNFWMPFHTDDHAWAVEHFGSLDLLHRHTVDVDHLLGDTPLLISSVYNVYLHHDTLIYVKNPCTDADTSAIFFMHIVPVNDINLPDPRKQYGYDNLDFHFGEYAWEANDRCVVVYPLPDYYEILSVLTGQYTPEQGRIWEAEINMRKERLDSLDLLHRHTVDIDHMLDDTPLLISSVYDVYLHQDTLIYVKNPCTDADTSAIFFMHIVPVNKVFDLPDERKQYGYDNLDFHFHEYALEANGRCVVVRPLPEYEIESVLTGQYTPEEDIRIWEETIRFDG